MRRAGADCLLSLVLMLALPHEGSSQAVIRINQAGYTPRSVKCALLCCDTPAGAPREFDVCDALTESVLWTSRSVTPCGAWGPFRETYRLDFSPYAREGGVYLRAGDVTSPVFRVGTDVYDGAADFLLRYIRGQQCGYNPVLHDSCHTHDGFVTGDSEREGESVDVVGGWHDASDYLRYAATSATATFQLLFAYRRNPRVFADACDGAGNPVPNGVPDVLDAARWGLAWLLKMNPSPDVMYNQVADDRDHLGFRLPSEDTVSYGRGRARPVYLCTGAPQGSAQYVNRSTGIASTAGKFASAFAYGSLVFRSIDSSFAAVLLKKAREAYALGLAHPGVCQTAPRRAPYFYEEENWVDDMELAAGALYESTGERGYISGAEQFARTEPVTPWMLNDTARHYQWYPFVNLGHALIALNAPGESAPLSWYREGLSLIRERGEKNPFGVGTPFLWCSNNYVSASLMQTLLYESLSGDSSFARMEAALRDWLFGCNPWGTSMVIGYPPGGASPHDPHSAFSHAGGYTVDGGLVDGPVRGSTFGSLKGVHLSRGDALGGFQSDRAVYHDDWADYSTNEPTLDGTAELVAALALIESPPAPARKGITIDRGGITRCDSLRKRVYLVFTGHEFAGEGRTILRALARRRIRASFFFTGDFYRNPGFAPLIRSIREGGHYLGAHSDRHLLYAVWERRDSLLVGKEEFYADIRRNYAAMQKFGVRPEDARYFLPPYEWYNGTVAGWVRAAGLTLVNFTPGTYANADYTTPAMGDGYRGSAEIYRRILDVESKSPRGLNGYILLMHVGTDPGRKDKFARRLDALVAELQKRGYGFGTFRDAELDR
ncbi:MAG TPA: glycoside hydrolase family 9 protein [Bacteroidota bacterium]|nr:glycoside hydrolase family 9 protein [Bacteroidota bacterium]